ncbi:hypothetical protein [Pseudonocardia humida]|uniref:ABM domain-containing protein n=1 Tax=Pseudonocardia humida TaxID=2800819 RepID=A0ABT0ZSG8_9PSEU|nr:hypothetical protein [Pseudonocardia humida]MCO1653657.1 hypothetical protein [Pseudonocardia humida]
MHARVNIIFGERDRVEDGVARLEEADRAAVEAAAGNRGLVTMVDRAGGVIVAVSYWDESTHSSEAALTRARDIAAAAAGGDLVVEGYEVALREGAPVAAPGAAVRLTRVRVDPSRVPAALEFLRDALPRLRSCAGFAGGEVLVDRGAGVGLLVTVWAADGAAELAGAVLQRLREDGALRAGMAFPGTEAYVLVRARVPAATG